MMHSMEKTANKKTVRTIQTGKSILLIDPESQTVTKKFHDPDSLYPELKIYHLKPDFAPQLLDHNNRDTLILSYIPSVTLFQYITCDQHVDFRPIARLHQKLHGLKQHDGLSLCHIDTNPRNYLYDGNIWWMIDFEESQMSEPEEDAIHFLLFLASEYPSSMFRNAVRSYLSVFQEGYLRLDRWRSLFPVWIDRFDKRRKRYRDIEPSMDARINRMWLDFSDPDDYRTKIFPDPS